MSDWVSSVPFMQMGERGKMGLEAARRCGGQGIKSSVFRL